MWFGETGVGPGWLEKASVLLMAAGFGLILLFASRRKPNSVKALLLRLVDGLMSLTNVTKLLVCGITSISYDHVAQLGNTPEQIAEEKNRLLAVGARASRPHGARHGLLGAVGDEVVDHEDDEY